MVLLAGKSGDRYGNQVARPHQSKPERGMVPYFQKKNKKVAPTMDLEVPSPATKAQCKPFRMAEVPIS